MGTMKNIAGLLAVEVFAVFLLYIVVKYAFGIDIFDFKSTHGKLVAAGIVGLFLYTFATFLFEPNALQTLGADARYNPSDKNRMIAASPIKPTFF